MVGNPARLGDAAPMEPRIVALKDPNADVFDDLIRSPPFITYAVNLLVDHLVIRLVPALALDLKKTCFIPKNKTLLLRFYFQKKLCIPTVFKRTITT
jgi:hypothetical protein